MGFRDYVDGIGDFILGPEDGSFLDRTSSVFQRGVSAGALFSPLGDVGDVFTGVTGIDHISGDAVDGFERWLGLLGVGGMSASVIGGARMAKLGFPAQGLLTRPGGPARSIDMTELTMVNDSFVTKKTRAIDRALTRLNDEEGLTNPGLTFMSTQGRTNDVLKLDLDVDLAGPSLEFKGWEKMARDVMRHYGPNGAVVELGDGSLQGVAQVAGFLEGVLGPKLMDHLPSAAAYLGQRFDNPDPHAAMKFVSMTVAQWEFADVWENFRFEGKIAPQALDEWRNLKKGVVTINSELLADAMTKFAVATDWVQDPELRLNPLVAIQSINLDGEQGVLSLKALQWKQVSLDQLTGRAAQERVRALVGMHPSNMVLLLKDNLSQLMEQALQKPEFHRLWDEDLGAWVDGDPFLWEEWMTDMQH
ncbi:MAG: hypothetical protein HKO53_13155, partial [Gemmatimonadetes bacterium]|nr:hypothetical protein [Gemmatimonadota bacterium]